MTIKCETCGHYFPRTLRGEALAKAIEDHEEKVHASTQSKPIGVRGRR